MSETKKKVKNTKVNVPDITSGTVPAARFPSSFPATSGAGLKLISKTTNSTSGIASITISLPNDNTRYLLYCKRLCFSNNTYPRYELLDASGNQLYFSSTWMVGYSESDTASGNMTNHYLYAGWSMQDYGFIMEITRISGIKDSFMARSFGIAREEMKGEIYTILDNASNSINQIRFTPWDNTGSYPRTIEPNTEILLYQYNE